MDKTKPKKKVIVHNESKSLWNYSISPGWTEDDVRILKLALQKFGIGKWRNILNSQCLPGKSIGQIYIQTQRMLGQQSLGDFMGVQIDLERVWRDNANKTGVMRKNGCIINTGDNPNREERKQRIRQNQEKYGISQDEIAKIKLPRYKLESSEVEFFTIEEIENDQFTTLEKLNHFSSLLNEVNRKIDTMEKEEEIKKKIKLNQDQPPEIQNEA